MFFKFTRQLAMLKKRIIPAEGAYCLFFKFVGWVAVALSLPGLFFGFAPGVMAIFAYMILVIALLLSVISIKSGNVMYFKLTALVATTGALFVNSSTSLLSAAGSPPWQWKIVSYIILAFILATGLLFSRRQG